jgi:5-methylcytosine-specific restriction endonuclease McrA
MQSKYSIEELKLVVSESNSLRAVLLRLNMAPAGSNYTILKTRIRANNISTDHFGTLNTTTNWKPAKPFHTYLTANSSMQSNKVRVGLLKHKYKDHRCERCCLATWLDQPIPLEVDHINGVSTDNRLSNLRLLCPNCHALTPTYRGKNKKRKT